MKRIFVGNLSFNSTPEDLRSLFANYGSVQRVNIMTDRETGRSRGFAFVEMAVDDEAGNAIAILNGYELDGRALRISEARPRGESSGGQNARLRTDGNRRRYDLPTRHVPSGER